MIALLWLACAEPEPRLPPMDTTRLAIRASLDLRGVRPETAELDRLDSDPSQIDAMIDEWSRDPRFGARVADLWSEVYLTRTETWPVYLGQFPALVDAGVTEAEFTDSIGREPLELLRHVADEDLPWTAIVTAEHTMADRVIAGMYRVEREPGDGFTIATYTDARPMAGVLSTNALWLRYGTTDSNANRKRANQASRILVCNDYLHRPIEFDRNVNLLDTGAVEQAIRTDAGCVACHSTLDPIASYFYGFWPRADAPQDMLAYHPDRERLWSDYTGVGPAWYGDPGYNLRDLGQQIASDPRFVTCAVEQGFELLLRREATAADADRLTAVREEFIADGLTMRALLVAVVKSPEYAAGPTDDAAAVPTKMLTPDLLASATEDVTGFRWTTEGWDLLRSDAYGFRSLAGGADGTYATRSATSPNATLVLVQERLAEAAAAYAVEHDGSRPVEARLFTEVDFDETPASDRDAMVRQVQRLHRRIFGTTVAADGAEVEANLALWDDLYAIERDERRAWAGVLTALLRDPEFLLY